ALRPDRPGKEPGTTGRGARAADAAEGPLPAAAGGRRRDARGTREAGAGGGIVRQGVFTGARKDVPSIVHAADAGVLVSNAVETISLAALEVMAAGLPMVLSDIG